MKVSHSIRPVFDDPNLVSAAGVVPALGLAASAGLHELLEEHNAASVEIATRLRKPDALTMPRAEVRRLGHPQRVRGRLRLDYREKYRNLRDIAPHVYS